MYQTLKDVIAKPRYYLGMIDKTINNALRQLHRECMNDRHEGLEHVVALMRLRGVEPSFKP